MKDDRTKKGALMALYNDSNSVLGYTIWQQEAYLHCMFVLSSYSSAKRHSTTKLSVGCDSATFSVGFAEKARTPQAPRVIDPPDFREDPQSRSLNEP